MPPSAVEGKKQSISLLRLPKVLTSRPPLFSRPQTTPAMSKLSLTTRKDIQAAEVKRTANLKKITVRMQP